MDKTTVAGAHFLRTPLGSYKSKVDKAIGLPGLGPANTAKLEEIGIVNAAQLFGQYLAFNRDHAIFLKYLESNVGLAFVGNQYSTKEDIKAQLCNTLDAKWDILKNY